MLMGQKIFFIVEQKSFDVVVEGRGVRVYENGKGFQKSIFFFWMMWNGYCKALGSSSGSKGRYCGKGAVEVVGGRYGWH